VTVINTDTKKIYSYLYHSFQKIQQNTTVQPSSTLIIIRIIYWLPNLHIRMISEGSCDTEEWKLSFPITGIN